MEKTALLSFLICCLLLPQTGFAKGPDVIIRVDSSQPNFDIRPESRDAIFRQGNLLAPVEKARLDQLDRDVLYYRLKTLPLTQLTEQYPALPKSALQKTKQLIKASSR